MKQVKTKEDLINFIQTKLKQYKEKGYNNIGIITKTSKNARELYSICKSIDGMQLISTNDTYTNGCVIIVAFSSKGLEFDAVVMWDASKAAYHKLDETQLVYTITSRAMYKLDIIYTGEKSPLLDVDPDTYEEK